MAERPPPHVNLMSQKMGIHEWSYDNAISNDARNKVPWTAAAKALADAGLDPAAAADPRYALDMAPRLVAFSEDVARAAGQRPVTYIGHSYGGSIVGTAERFGLTADRVIYTEAAGAGAAWAGAVMLVGVWWDNTRAVTASGTSAGSPNAAPAPDWRPAAGE